MLPTNLQNIHNDSTHQICSKTYHLLCLKQTTTQLSSKASSTVQHLNQSELLPSSHHTPLFELRAILHCLSHASMTGTLSPYSARRIHLHRSRLDVITQNTNIRTLNSKDPAWLADHSTFTHSPIVACPLPGSTTTYTGRYSRLPFLPVRLFGCYRVSVKSPLCTAQG